MSKRFKVNGSKLAIWDGHTDTDPFDNPLASSTVLNRVKFHSSLSYVSIVDTQAVSLALASRTNFQSATQTHTLFAHGRSGIPLVLGIATVGGAPVALTGSVPVQLGTLSVSTSGSTVGWFGRWITIGADATNVYAYEYVVAQWINSGNCETFPAITIPLTLHVTSELL